MKGIEKPPAVKLDIVFFKIAFYGGETPNALIVVSCAIIPFVRDFIFGEDSLYWAFRFTSPTIDALISFQFKLQKTS